MIGASTPLAGSFTTLTTTSTIAAGGRLGVNGVTAANLAVAMNLPNLDYIGWFDSGSSGAQNASIRGNAGQLEITTNASGLWCKQGVNPSSGGGSTAPIFSASSGAGSATTYIGNATINVTSDKRLKDNIAPTTRDALAIIKNLEVVDCTWNDPSDKAENNRNSRGRWTVLIAQQAIEHVPWLVNAPDRTCAVCLAGKSCDEHNVYEAPWRIEYESMVPLLVKAIQQATARIETLEAALDVGLGSKAP